MSELEKKIKTNNNQDNLVDIPQEIKDLEGFNDFINSFQDKKNEIIQLISDESKKNKIIKKIKFDNFPTDLNQLEDFFKEFGVNKEIKGAKNKERVLAQYEIRNKEKLVEEGNEKNKEGNEKNKEKQQLLSGFITSINELKFNDPKFVSFVQEITNDFKNGNLTEEKVESINEKITNYGIMVKSVWLEGVKFSHLGEIKLV